MMKVPGMEKKDSNIERMEKSLVGKIINQVEQKIVRMDTITNALLNNMVE